MASKKYNEFDSGNPEGTDITLFANPTTGVLKKTAIGFTYSFDEQETKDTWHDGKKIFCKSFNIGSGSNDYYVFDELTTDMVDSIVDIKTIATNAISGSWSVLTPEIELDGDQYQIFVVNTAQNVISTVWYTKK